MEMELGALIEKIKNQGVQKAEEHERKIVSGAEAKADAIIKEAEKKKDAILKEAAQDAEHFRKTAESAVRQAARDTLLETREAISGMFSEFLKEKTAKALDEGQMKELITKVVAAFISGKTSAEVALSEEDKKKFGSGIINAFKKDIADKLELVVSGQVKKGFRVGEKGKGSYLDFTDEAIAEAIARHLSGDLTALVEKDLGLKK